MNNMNETLSVVMDDETLELFLDGESYGISDTDTNFNPWKQKTGKQTVFINGSPCVVWIDAFEPSCSCCIGIKPVYNWEMTLA